MSLSEFMVYFGFFCLLLVCFERFLWSHWISTTAVFAFAGTCCVLTAYQGLLAQDSGTIGILTFTAFCWGYVTGSTGFRLWQSSQRTKTNVS